MTTLSELQEGDTLVAVDPYQDCIVKSGKYTVILRGGDLQIRCAKGTHYIGGNVGTDGHLIGWEKVK